MAVAVSKSVTGSGYVNSSSRKRMVLARIAWSPDPLGPAPIGGLSSALSVLESTGKKVVSQS